MSYCRFIEGDVYLYADAEDSITCAMCLLAPRVRSIFTTGGDVLGLHMEPCPHCHGAGCDACMLQGDTKLDGPQAALAHLHAHRRAGHTVPQDAFDRLEEEIVGGG